MVKKRIVSKQKNWRTNRRTFNEQRTFASRANFRRSAAGRGRSFSFERPCVPSLVRTRTFARASALGAGLPTAECTAPASASAGAQPPRDVASARRCSRRSSSKRCSYCRRLRSRWTTWRRASASVVARQPPPAAAAAPARLTPPDASTAAAGAAAGAGDASDANAVGAARGGGGKARDCWRFRCASRSAAVRRFAASSASIAR